MQSRPPRFVFRLGSRRKQLSRSGSGGRPERSPSLFVETKVIAKSVVVPLWLRQTQAGGDAGDAMKSRERRGNFCRPFLPRSAGDGGGQGAAVGDSDPRRSRGSAGREGRVSGEGGRLPRERGRGSGRPGRSCGRLLRLRPSRGSGCRLEPARPGCGPDLPSVRLPGRASCFMAGP